MSSSWELGRRGSVVCWCDCDYGGVPVWGCGVTNLTIKNVVAPAGQIDFLTQKERNTKPKAKSCARLHTLHLKSGALIIKYWLNFFFHQDKTHRTADKRSGRLCFLFTERSISSEWANRWVVRPIGRCKSTITTLRASHPLLLPLSRHLSTFVVSSRDWMVPRNWQRNFSPSLEPLNSSSSWPSLPSFFPSARMDVPAAHRPCSSIPFSRPLWRSGGCSAPGNCTHSRTVWRVKTKIKTVRFLIELVPLNWLEGEGVYCLHWLHPAFKVLFSFCLRLGIEAAHR